MTRDPGLHEAATEAASEAASEAMNEAPNEAMNDAPGRRFRPPSRRTFVAMLGAAAAAVVLRDRISGQHVVRNPATGKPIWIGHV